MAGSAVEGAFYGAGRVVHEAALGDPNLTAESALATVGLSAAMMGAVGGGSSVVGSLLGEAAKHLPGWVGDTLDSIESHANLQAAGGDKGSARRMIQKYGPDGARARLLEMRDIGIFGSDGGSALVTPHAVMDNAREILSNEGGKIGDMIKAADASGNVNVDGAARRILASGEGIINKMGENPFQEDAAGRLRGLLAKYEQKISVGAKLEDLHGMEREFGQEVYGLKGMGDPRATPQIDALNKIRREISTVVDEGVERGGVPAKDWLAANRTFSIAKDAEKMALNGVARLEGNNPLSLSGTMGAIAGFAQKGPIGGVLSGAATEAAKRYGSGLTGLAARTLKNALGDGGAEVAGRTAEAIAAARKSGADTLSAGASRAPEAVTALAALERSNQTMKNRVDDAVSTLVRSGAKASNVMRAEAAAGISGSFAKTAEEQAALYAKRVGIIRKAAVPQNMYSALEKNSDDLHAHAPQTAAALNIAQARLVSHLASKIPQTMNQGPLSTPAKPNRTEIRDFSQRWEVAHDPVSAIRHAAAGTLTPAALETLHAGYPALSATIVEAIHDKIAAVGPQKVPRSAHAMLSALTGEPLHSSVGGDAILRNQSVFAAPSAQAGNALRPSQHGASSLSAGTRFLTSAQASSQRKD